MILYTSTLSPADYLPACSFVETSATLGNRPLIFGHRSPARAQTGIASDGIRRRKAYDIRKSIPNTFNGGLSAQYVRICSSCFLQAESNISKKHLAAREVAPLQPQFRPFFKQPTLVDRCLCLPHCRLVKHLLTQMRQGKPGRVCGLATCPRADADNNAACFHVT